MNAFETDGYWWLPESPDAQVPGRLSVAADGRAELSLVGALDSYLAAGETTVGENGEVMTTFTEESMARSGVYPRVLGLADSGIYTLEDCLQTHRSLGRIETQRVEATQVLRGVHFEPGEPLEFHKLSAEMDWLPFWVLQSGLGESYTYSGDNKIVAVDVKITPLDAQTCAGQDGTTVRLSQGFSLSGNRVTERRMAQSFSLSIEAPKLLPLETLLEQMSDLQDLVSIGTGRSAAYSSLQAQHPDVLLAIPGESIPTSIDIFGRWQVVSLGSSDTLNAHDMFFSLADLGGMQGVERWLAVAGANRSELGRVMATRYSRAMYVSDKVLNCTAALEAYDRNSHPNDNLVDRLKRLAGTAGDAFEELVGDVESWAKALKDARHDVAHHRVGMASASTGHLFLGNSAYWLFVMCLLREAQAPSGVFDHIKAHSEYHWLSRHVKDMLGMS